jgi:hypothetical protein
MWWKFQNLTVGGGRLSLYLWGLRVMPQIIQAATIPAVAPALNVKENPASDVREVRILESTEVPKTIESSKITQATQIPAVTSASNVKENLASSVEKVVQNTAAETPKEALHKEIKM